jgi:hypothetical protein
MNAICWQYISAALAVSEAAYRHVHLIFPPLGFSKQSPGPATLERISQYSSIRLIGSDSSSVPILY